MQRQKYIYIKNPGKIDVLGKNSNFLFSSDFRNKQNKLRQEKILLNENQKSNNYRF